MKKFVIDAPKNQKLSEMVFQNIPQVSYHTLQKILRKKDVIVNRVRVAKDVQLQKGDFVEIYCPDREVKYFSVVYDDENIIVVNKAFGIIVAEKDKTRPHEISLQELVQKHCKKPVFALHRIDMNTSGLVVFCKTPKVFDEMKNAMKNHQVKKTYLAEVVGKFNLPPATHCAFLVKDTRTHSVRVAGEKTSPRAVEISTFAALVEMRDKTSIVRVQISNGKTHQIRAHMAFLGFPLVGDNKYGKKTDNKKFGTRKQKLLAQKLEFSITSPKMKYLNDLVIELPKNVVEEYFLNK